jgi:hypothetical protein
MNLVGTGNNKRYSLDGGGISNPSPHRVAWVEEPLVVGARLAYEF